MKKFLSFITIAAVALFLTSCGTTKKVSGSGIKGNTAKVQKSEVTIIDYQGSTWGGEIPQWVIEVGNGNYSGPYLRTIMPNIGKNDRIFVTMARGDNLDFVQQWTDLVDIEVQVGDEMQRVVGKAVSAQQKARATATGDVQNPTELEKELNMYKQAVSAVELNGLKKISSYWVQKEVKRSKKDKESKVYYEYYAVWSMDEKVYNAQLANAMNNISDNTDEGKELKATLTKKLQSMMFSSNNDELNDEYNDFL